MVAEEGLKLEPFDLSLKQASEQATQGILKDLLQGQLCHLVSSTLPPEYDPGAELTFGPLQEMIAMQMGIGPLEAQCSYVTAHGRKRLAQSWCGQRFVVAVCLCLAAPSPQLRLLSLLHINHTCNAKIASDADQIMMLLPSTMDFGRGPGPWRELCAASRQGKGIVGTATSRANPENHLSPPLCPPA